MTPNSPNGKICYVEVPATNVERSAEFYGRVFGWKFGKRGEGATAFDDTAGQVSGAFVTNRPPMSLVGLLVYVMVDDAAATLARVVASGGEIVQPVGGMRRR